MTKSDLGRTVAAIACTVVMSATCLLAAVGPAEAGRAAHPVQATTRTIA